MEITVALTAICLPSLKITLIYTGYKVIRITPGDIPIIARFSKVNAI